MDINPSSPYGCKHMEVVQLRDRPEAGIFTLPCEINFFDEEKRWTVQDVNKKYRNPLFYRGNGIFMYDSRRNRSRYDAVWDGRDALLIESKRGKVEEEVSQDSYDKKAPKEDNKKVFTGSLWSAYIEMEENKRQVEMKAKAVAALTLGLMHFCNFESLKEQLSRKECQFIYRTTFKSFAKFILSVFYADDLVRVSKRVALHNQAEALYSELSIVKVLAKCNPVIAVAKAKIDLDKYPDLNEEDVADILWQHQVFSGDAYLLCHSLTYAFYPIVWDEISKSEVKSAMMVMEEYTPLREDCKMQLTLEMSQGKCYHVLDTLFLEALKGIEIQSLVKSLGDKSDWLLIYMGVIRGGLYGLSFMRQTMLEHLQRAVVFPLRCGVFGPCTDEFLEVVRIANLEKRMQGHRFISRSHILFSLLHSRVGHIVQRELKYVDKTLSKVPLYSLYELARHVATNFGDRVMGIEHLVLALTYEMKVKLLWKPCPADLPLYFYPRKVGVACCTLAGLLKRLRKSKRKFDVKSWRDPFIWADFAPKERIKRGVLCWCLYEMLREVNYILISGYKLPPIRRGEI